VTRCVTVFCAETQLIELIEGIVRRVFNMHTVFHDFLTLYIVVHKSVFINFGNACACVLGFLVFVVTVFTWMLTKIMPLCVMSTRVDMLMLVGVFLCSPMLTRAIALYKQCFQAPPSPQVSSAPHLAHGEHPTIHVREQVIMLLRIAAVLACFTLCSAISIQLLTNPVAWTDIKHDTIELQLLDTTPALVVCTYSLMHACLIRLLSSMVNNFKSRQPCNRGERTNPNCALIEFVLTAFSLLVMLLLCLISFPSFLLVFCLALPLQARCLVSAASVPCHLASVSSTFRVRFLDHVVYAYLLVLSPLSLLIVYASYFSLPELSTSATTLLSQARWRTSWLNLLFVTIYPTMHLTYSSLAFLWVS
jgi:hypothetical protein